MNYTEEQILEWKNKAEKWDALDEQLSTYYLQVDDGETDEADLCDIGETAAAAFGYL